MGPSPEEITVLLAQFAKGDEGAISKLLPLVYDELHRLAASYMRRERPDHTLQPTALVNEAYLKLLEQHDANWQNRAHFFGVAAQLMRRILIDHARGHLRAKRGAGQKVALDEALAFSEEQSGELVALHEALERLEKLDARQGRIVELRFFGGLTLEETASVLDISPKTVERDWQVAKAWLNMELKEGRGSDTGEVGKGQGAV
jgi:RNA polymerase sigma factor (TIGR02999 family)